VNLFVRYILGPAFFPRKDSQEITVPDNPHKPDNSGKPPGKPPGKPDKPVKP
jgi:hypothetical protein